ncbi:glycosyltransferase family 4 protein [Candidatus Gracilibacteria bacterium]|nr:glycosyltransferase family 4 protein [Candidatus Gracilibacteria bacterium]
MKIGINARFLAKPYTGIGQYTIGLLKELGKMDIDIVAVVAEKVDYDFGDRVQIVVVPQGRMGTAGVLKTYWEQIKVSEFFVKEGVDLAWFTYACNPWTRDWTVPTVVSVHDCIPWKLAKYRRGFLSKMYHKMSRKAVAAADLVLTVSEFSKGEIVELCGVAADKVQVIYNDAADVYGSGGASGILKKLGVDSGKYFLYVGGYDDRKNVARLVSERSKKWPLVLAGGKLFDSSLYESFDEADGVIKTGFLSEEELAALYSGCGAFVSLSKYEGFNIPVVEAANAGAPLILSDIPVHHEVAEDGAVYVGSDDSLREKMEGKMVDSSSVAKKYDWAKSADQLVKCFRSLLQT